jgi:hypothetical protein
MNSSKPLASDEIQLSSRQGVAFGADCKQDEDEEEEDAEDDDDNSPLLNCAAV